jgi:hypothetical protein
LETRFILWWVLEAGVAKSRDGGKGKISAGWRLLCVWAYERGKVEWWNGGMMARTVRYVGGIVNRRIVTFLLPSNVPMAVGQWVGCPRN